MIHSKIQSKQLHNMYFNWKQAKKYNKVNLRSSKGRQNIFQVLVTKAILELITHGTGEKDLQHLGARST